MTMHRMVAGSPDAMGLARWLIGRRIEVLLAGPFNDFAVHDPSHQTGTPVTALGTHVKVAMASIFGCSACTGTFCDTPSLEHLTSSAAVCYMP